MFRDHTLPSLRAAVLQGLALSALSACGGSTITPDPEGPGSGGAQQSSGGSSSGGAQSGGSSGGASSNLPPLPPEDDLECVGENYGGGSGYSGRCCPEVSCMKASADGTCPEAESEPVRQLPGYPPGSGSCSCEPTQGPYASSAGETAVQGEGDCCYVIYSISCEGRPLRQQDVMVVAAIVARHDWMMS